MIFKPVFFMTVVGLASLVVSIFFVANASLSIHTSLNQLIAFCTILTSERFRLLCTEPSFWLYFSFGVPTFCVFLFRHHISLSSLNDYFAGLLYLIGAPLLTYYLYEAVLRSLNIWGNDRGEFNDWFVPLLIAVNLVFFGLFSFSGKKKA